MKTYQNNSHKSYCVWVAAVGIWMNVILAVTNYVDFEVLHHLSSDGIRSTNHYLRDVLQLNQQTSNRSLQRQQQSNAMMNVSFNLSDS